MLRCRVPGQLLSPSELSGHFDAILPAIEVVETRLADWKTAPPLAQLADMQSHGALVLGEPAALDVSSLDLRQVEARLEFDGQVVAQRRGGNPAAEVWRMLAHLALHCEQRRMPLTPGQIVTTGSCTGMLFAPVGSHVSANVMGIGRVALQF
jgi:2-keto-4-pentenoate hydratase